MQVQLLKHKQAGSGNLIQASTTLPDILTKNGFIYTICQRGNKTFIFRQTVSPGVEYFEVFRKRISKPKNINGKIIPAKERFPKDEDFGLWAWTYSSYERALEKFNQLENEQL